MSTIFERIEEGLSGNDLAEQLTTQVTTLNTIGTSLSDLIQNPPTQIGDLINNINNISLPDTNLLGELPASITNLKSIIPSDISNVTGNLSSGITDLLQSISRDIIDQLRSCIDAFNSLYSLLQILSQNRESESSGIRREMSAVLPSLNSIGTPSDHLTASSLRILTSSTVVDEINKIIEALNRFPDPFNVENVLQLLFDVIKIIREKISCVPGTYLPFLDEIYQTLETLLDWKTLDGTQIANHIESTLQAAASFINQSADPAIQPLIHRINRLSSNIDTVTLKTTLEGLSQEIRNLGLAVENVNLSDVNATLLSLNNLSTQLNTILQSLQTHFFDGQTENLLEKLTEFPLNLEGQIHRVFSILDPESDSEILHSFAENLNNAFESEEVNTFVEPISELVDWFKELLARLDLTVIEEPINTAATSAQSTIDALDNILVEIVTHVSLLFDEVEEIINLVDTNAIASAIETAISDFQQLLQDQIDTLFTPIRDAISTAVTTTDGVVDDFDPESVIDALRSAIQTLTGVLTDPEVINTLNNVKEILDNIIEELNSLSFTPVNDLVIDQIEEVTDTLANIDTSDLNSTLKAALRAALEVLPDDEYINSLIDSLCEEMDNLIDTGPIPVMNIVKKQPDRLLQKVRDYSPENLIGDQLSQPFQQLLKKLQAFKPSNLLNPVQDALDETKTILQTNANPGQFIEPLEQPFDDLMQAFNSLKPEDLIAPLQEHLNTVINSVLNAMPLDEFFEIVDTILEKIQNFVDSIEAIKNLIQRILNMINGLNEPDRQIDEWITGILEKLDQVPDSVNLQTSFDQISDSINTIKAQPLQDRIIGSLQPFISSLDTLQPQSLLNEVIRNYRDFPYDAIDSLPNPEKQNVLNFFNDFDPLNPEISGPLANLQNFLENLENHPQIITDFFTEWDNRYHGQNSPLNRFIPEETSIQAVKDILANTIDQQVKAPLTAIFQVAPIITQFVEGFIDVINQFVSDLHTKLASLLNGPTSLTTIRDAMNAIVDKIRNFNLNFLVDELEDVFDNVKDKLDPISPKVLRGIVEANFSQTLKNLDISQLMPQEQIDDLDTDFELLITKVSHLDPQKLVIDVVQPEFNKMIQPYLDTFDLTEYIQALIERLERLKEELRTELDRTGRAFSNMLNAVPL